MTKYYIEKTTKQYHGSFEGMDVNDPDLEEVPFPPQHGRQVWDGSGWGPIPDTRTTREKRKSEYPDIDDQLDAIFKYLGRVPAATGDVDLGPVITEINRVRTKYPE